ncbi:MAG: hypothetical protein WAK86_00540, partial [Pseudonocardiaceae bacterium]
ENEKVTCGVCWRGDAAMTAKLVGTTQVDWTLGTPRSTPVSRTATSPRSRTTTPVPAVEWLRERIDRDHPLAYARSFLAARHPQVRGGAA